MRLIKGMTPEIMDKLLQYVTVYPQDGESKVNVNTADSLVLQALDPGITESMAAEIIQARPLKRPIDLDNVGSVKEVFAKLRLASVYDVKSNIFSAQMSLTVSETTKSGVVVLQRDEATGNSSVLYFRFL
jgi:general secretion pathway protein K